MNPSRHMSQIATHPLEQPRSEMPAGNLSRPPLVLAGVLALAHLPLLVLHGKNLWAREHYQYFPLVIAGVIALAIPAYRKARESGPSRKALSVARFLLGLNWVMLATAMLLSSPLLGTIAFWELLIATALAAGGWPCLKAAWKPLVFFLLIVPPPFGWDERFILALQKLTSRASSRVLDLIPVYHFLNGVIVEVAGKKFEIERACSGISSLLSVVACTLFFIFYYPTHWLRGILLMLAAIFWVLVNNVTRVVVIVYCYTRFGIDLTNDSPPWFVHTLLGFVLFGLTLAMLWSTDCFLRFLGSAATWGNLEKRKTVGPVRSPAPAWSPGWGLVTPIAVAYGVLIFFQTVELALAIPAASMTELTAHYNAFTADTMPDEIDGWKQVKKQFAARDADSAFVPQGQHSRSWTYQKGILRILLSFDYAFPEWHDLRVCYSMTGWFVDDIAERAEFHVPVGSAGEVECVRFQMHKPLELRHGYGWFGEFDPNGKPVPIAQMHLSRGSQLHDRLSEVRSRWLSLVGAAQRPQPRRFEILQVQALVDGYYQLTDSEQAEYEKFFTKGLALVRDRAVAGLKK
ncbi:MAG: exosortase U [Gemmataceae bacterium]